jgi:hypothetical protein
VVSEELHRKYQHDLAEAKEKDRREVARVFVDEASEIGGFDVSHLTIRRYLILEQKQSPFLLGTTEYPSKEEVVDFLWVMNPKFDGSPSSRRWFKIRHSFRLIFWRRIAMEIGAMILEWMDSEQVPSEKKDRPSSPPDWIAKIVDGAASQYGWSEQEILDLPLVRVQAYVRAMTARLSGESQPAFTKHSDKVRHWYIRTLRNLQEEEK